MITADEGKVDSSCTCTSAELLSVALIGSSGGGAATLGHTDPTDLLTSVDRELCRIRRRLRCTSIGNAKDICPIHKDEEVKRNKYAYFVRLKYALYVSVHGGKGLDGANPDKVMATLYTVGCDEQLQQQPKQGNKYDNDNATLDIRSEYTGTLREVNQICQHLDQSVLSKAVGDHQISGLICISCDPKNIHAASLKRCQRQQEDESSTIAVTGSGGTSMAYISNVYGIPLVGNVGGSVATTTYTRATSYAYALAQAFSNRDSSNYEYYHDNNFNPQQQGEEEEEAIVIRPNIISVLNSSLPVFIAVAITKSALLQLTPVTDEDNDPLVHYNNHHFHHNIPILIHQLQWVVLPTVCSVISASCYGKEHGSTVLMAAAMVGASACQGSVLAGLLAGWLVSRLADHILWTCLHSEVPSTMTNLLLGGGIGAIVSIGYVATNLVYLLQCITELFRTTLHSLVVFVPGAGFILGCLFCYGSKVGWYHKYFLPSILIEMERGDASFLGAVDELTLVLVSAGICLANVVCRSTSSSSQRHLQSTIPAKRGLLINVLCGDFIEVAYPYMEESLFVNVMGYIASGISTELLLLTQQYRRVVLSSAYVPCFVSIWLAKDEWQSMAIASTVSLCVSFAGGIIGNFSRDRTKKE